MGRLEDARATLDEIEKTLKKKSPTPSVLLAIATSYARLSPDAVDPQEILDRITPLANDESCEANLRINAYFQMGRLHEKLKHYDDAFSCWANTKTLKHLKWDPDEHSRRVDKLIECWSADCAVPDSGIDGSRLIYICGMMRSGTSLTEQMIAQGEGVTPGGEMNAVSRRVSETEQERSPMFRPLPYSRAKYTQPTMTKITKLAWQMYNEVSQKSIITDKQPFNCFFIPLTVRMFPGCKVIHCMRDAQDCCLSNFMQSFSRPHPQTNELYWLGRYFRDYERMMDAWRSVAGESIIDLRYEDLVADPEGQSKRVMGFLGLPWTQDILNFHNSDRTVRTASREQVRKPIYKSSVKKHELYREHLADLRRGLGIDPEPAARP